LVKPAFKMENGRMAIPDKPRLGIEIDQDALEKY
jgi:L-alanine-DL-glutamate epimerase-like enolase superfamily enzyme